MCLLGHYFNKLGAGGAATDLRVRICIFTTKIMCAVAGGDAKRLGFDK
jgi:hypothetical protein